jgi:anti-sigma factor RsiW
MRCQTARSLLAKDWDGELAPAQARVVQEHRATCSECQAYAADLDLLTDVLAHLPPPESRPGFVARLLESLPEQTPRRWRDGWFGHLLTPARLALSGLALAAGIALAFYMDVSPRRTPVMPRPVDATARLYAEPFAPVPADSAAARYLETLERKGG